jgi:hypothetical protein
MKRWYKLKRNVKQLEKGKKKKREKQNRAEKGIEVESWSQNDLQHNTIYKHHHTKTDSNLRPWQKAKKLLIEAQVIVTSGPKAASIRRKHSYFAGKDDIFYSL